MYVAILALCMKWDELGCIVEVHDVNVPNLRKVLIRESAGGEYSERRVDEENKILQWEGTKN